MTSELAKNMREAADALDAAEKYIQPLAGRARECVDGFRKGNGRMTPKLRMALTVLGDLFDKIDQEGRTR